VLIANGRKDRPTRIAPIVVSLGHEVIARESRSRTSQPVIARERHDVALVGLDEISEHMLGLARADQASTTAARRATR
jgi:hypothetical protein